MIKKENFLNFYAKNRWLKYFPWVGNFLEHLKNSSLDKDTMAKIAKLRERYYFYKTFFQTAPRKYVGGLALNLLGFQIVRVLFHDFFWRLRQIFSPPVSSKLQVYFDSLQRDGVVIIRNAFTPEEVQSLVDDFNDKTPNFISHFEEFKEGLVLASNSIAPWTTPIGSKVAEDLVVNNPILKELIRASSGHRIRLTPEVSYLKYSPKLQDLGKEQVDGQDRIHCDVAYPSMKVFIYVTDSTVSNGAFIYCPGSHRVTLKRLIMEYKISIRYFLGTDRGEYKPTDLTNEEKKFLDLHENSMEGNAGSIIIFNTMGFHRRGNFTDASKPYRNVILSNYRYLDSFANKFGWKAF